MRDSLRRAYEGQLGRLVLDVPQGELRTSVADDAPALDLAATFGRTAPVVVEIGCGPGDSLVPMARARPEVDVLAFEVYEPAVAALVARLVREDVTERAGRPRRRRRRARAARAAGALSEVWTFFPDPWPKAKHHKRRLVDAGVRRPRRLPARAGRALAAGDGLGGLRGRRCASVLDAHPAFVAEPEERGDRPVTRFERRGHGRGPRDHRPRLPGSA